MFDGGMQETIALKKHKIILSDYDYRHDIENRLVMAEFSSHDFAVLEEILYSPLSISLKQLSTNLSIEESAIRSILKKLSKTGLLAVQGDLIAIDKEMRKYFESQILKFEEDFYPGIEYLQGLLRKVPIQVLPSWYSIPRTSNNIFDSLIEKYLITPQVYQRYLEELTFTNETLSGIVRDVHRAPEYKVRATDIIKKYGLSHEQFEEDLLLLEFHFACCLRYEKNGEKWEEVVTPFHEWREHLLFLQETEPKPIEKTNEIVRTRTEDFSFVQDISYILNHAKKQPIPMTGDLPEKSFLPTLAAKCKGLKEKDSEFLPYVRRLIKKLRQLGFAEVVDGNFCMLETAQEWLSMTLEHRALHLYRHPLNRLLTVNLPEALTHDRPVREAEKSIQRVLQAGWIYFDDFFKGVHVSVTPENYVMLKKSGKTWKYCLPHYSDEEASLIKATIFEWLFESAITATGTHEERDCFCVTVFGQSLFG
ncbi:MAG: hypothetical protein ACHQT8_00720 [Chlamydiales bacterium]